MGSPTLVPRSLLSHTLKRPSSLGGVLLVVSAVWVLATNWNPLANGHPSYLIFYTSAALLGLAVIFVGWRAVGAPRRYWVSVVAGLGLLLVALAGLWLSPFGAKPAALEVLDEPGEVSISQTSTYIVLEPPGDHPEMGIVFYPGARVDTRAYLHVLLPLAEAGNQVVIVKEPLGIAFLSLGFTPAWIEANPDIPRWVVGGHSLGGVVASSQAVSAETAGLLLWASFPASDISDSVSLDVISVYGTNDAIATPDDVLGSAPDLPATAVFDPVPGAIHSFFGDYGLQPGDGVPTIDRQAAQAQIAVASLELIAAVRGR